MRNGLYSVHARLGDGHEGKGSGVMTFRDGRLRGGDAFLFYVGDYEVSGDRIRGEVLINQHTPSPGRQPLFGGQEVGIGFSGTCTETTASISGTALVGKASLIFRASFRHLADLD